MGGSGKYSIPFKALAAGSYSYRFELDDDFFRVFGNSEISGGTGMVDAVLTKGSGSALDVEVEINASVTMPCDRCLDDFRLPVEYRGEFKVRFGDGEDNEEFDGDVMWLSEAESEIDLGHYIYESVVLSLPAQRVHADENECDPAMLGRFRIVSQEEFDKVAGGTEMQKMEDNPEWQKLRGIKLE